MVSYNKKIFKHHLLIRQASLMAQLVKNPPAMWETWINVGDLGSIPGFGRSLEKGKTTYFSILAWRIPWTV